MRTSFTTKKYQQCVLNFFLTFFFFFLTFSKNGSHLMRNKTFYGEVLLHMKSGLEGNPTYDVNIPLKQGWRSILAS